MPRTNLGVLVDAKSAYLVRASERLSLPEVDLTSLQQGLADRKAKCETKKGPLEKLKYQLLEQPSKEGGPDVAQSSAEVAEALRPFEGDTRGCCPEKKHLPTRLPGCARCQEEENGISVAGAAWMW